MPHKKIKLFLTILFSTILCYSNWETIGGNSQRTSFLDVVGPESKDDILWEGSLPSTGGRPILISDNKLVTMRVVDPNLEYAPLVCHDLFTGDTLWTLDFEGGYHSMSVPVGFKNNIIYASNWLENFSGDTLYAINANKGKIIWRSKIFIVGMYTIGIAFTGDGDLIIPTPDSVARINHDNGERIWCTKRIVPVSPSYDALTVFQNNIYGWFLGSSNELKVINIDIKSGSIKSSIEIFSTNPPITLLNGPIITVDKEGTVYALRANDNLVALENKNDSLSVLWNIPIRNGGYTNPAIGQNESVYFIKHNKIMRANTKTGEIIDSSIIVNADTSKHLNGYFAIDGNGTVYFNNHNYDNGILYSFSKDLKLIWIDYMKGIGHGGPAISKHGLLAIAGADNLLRVYKPINLKANKISSNYLNQETSFAISPHFITFKYYVQYNTNVKLLLYNLKGQTIYSRNNLPDKLGFNTIRIEDSNFNFSNGTYIFKLKIGSETKTKALNILK